MSTRLARRGFKRLLAVVAFVLLSIYVLSHLFQKENSPPPLSPPLPEELRYDIPDDSSYLPMMQAEKLCAAHHWKPFPHRKLPRKVYDMFLVSTELDWLEIRMGELQHVVDYFVIVEAPLNFVNLPKPLHLLDNWDMFSRWHHKMIYHTLNESEVYGTFKDTFSHEAFQRNALLDQVLAQIPDADPRRPHLDDVLLVSDVDEIPRPSTVHALRNCVFPKKLTLASRFYYYSYQWLHRGQDWSHPQATYYQGPDFTIPPDKLRMSGIQENLETVDNAAWHCSSCYPKLADFVTKITGFSHTKFNKPEFVDRSKILYRVRNGLDLFDREGEFYDRVDGNMDLPRYLKDNAAKFDYMLDRDPPSGNFRDFDEADSVAST